MSVDFSRRHVAALDRSVYRLGLAPSYGLTADDTAYALASDRFEYIFWTQTMRKTLPAVREALQADRGRYVLATGPSLGWFGGSVRRGAERILKTLGTDYIDVFHLFWLGKTSAWTDATQKELVALKEEGIVRHLGVSIHDRERAGELARDSPLDLLMIRYNAAHPGAEQDIFPHLHHRNPAVVAYTATRWRKLLKRPRGWEGRVPTAGDCYRFCLSSPHVDLVLTGPANRQQLDENMAALDAGPMDEQEMAWMREFGRVVHG